MSAVSNYNSLSGILSLANSYSSGSLIVTKLAKNVKLLTLGIFGVMALANLPSAEAGVGAYWTCIQTCVQSMGGQSWAATFVCPTVCAPFLLGPG